MSTVRFGFLTHLSRSGSTFLSRVMNQHKDVCVALEANLPIELFGIGRYRTPVFTNNSSIRRYLDVIFTKSKISTWKIGKEAILDAIDKIGYPLDGSDVVKALLALYRDRYKPGSKICIYKGSPAMPWHSRRLMASYPDAFLIHILRDPRAVYSSQKHSVNPYTGKPFSRSVVETAYRWKRGVQSVGHVDKNRKLELTYEALVRDLPSIRRKLASFLNIREDGFESGSGYLESLPAVERSMHSLVESEPDPSRLSVWKNSLDAGTIKFIEHYLYEEMSVYNYAVMYDSTAINRLHAMIRVRIHAFIQELFRTFRILVDCLRGDRRGLYKFRLLFTRKI